MLYRTAEEPDMKMGEKLKMFMAAHWRGVFLFAVPSVLSVLVFPLPGEPAQWASFTLLLMAIFWVSECIPLAVTGFMPCLVFPLTGVMETRTVTATYINDSVLMFLGSLMLASSVEQSGFHKRLAYAAIRSIGYSHFRLFFAICSVTCFVSMWMTNTAATTMMVPIAFAILRVFESEGILRIYDKNDDGSDSATSLTSAYFCAITFSATIGGIGTLVGTATNLVFKNLFMSKYKNAPEFLSFPLFSAFAVPYMVVLQACAFVSMAWQFFGFLRPNSEIAKQTTISEKGKKAAEATIITEAKKLGSLTFWEVMVIILFGGAILLFFSRSPQIFTGWGDMIAAYFNENKKFVKDSSLAALITFLMFILPNSLAFFDNFSADNYEELPKKPIGAVLSWKIMNAELPYSFMFLLGGGVALSKGARETGLNDKIGACLTFLQSMPNLVVLMLIIIVVCFVTNFASNVAVCNVFGPICMTLAEKLHVNPLWYIITCGITASYCFMLPVGTPGNLVIQNCAKVTTGKMFTAGIGPTVSCLITTWFFIAFYAPVIWPVLYEYPSWIEN